MGDAEVPVRAAPRRRARHRAAVTLFLVALLGLLGAGVAAVPAKAATAADARALRAKVTSEPWGFALVDDRGRPVLAQHDGTGTGPTGTLGFRAAGVWRHATRVLSARRDGETYVAELATTDPTGRRLEVRVRPDREGVIALEASVLGATVDVEALGIGFDAGQSERYLGFGERSNAIDQRGNAVENYVSDGP